MYFLCILHFVNDTLVYLSSPYRSQSSLEGYIGAKNTYKENKNLFEFLKKKNVGVKKNFFFEILKEMEIEWVKISNFRHYSRLLYIMNIYRNWGQLKLPHTCAIVFYFFHNWKKIDKKDKPKKKLKILKLKRGKTIFFLLEEKSFQNVLDHSLTNYQLYGKFASPKNCIQNTKTKNDLSVKCIFQCCSVVFFVIYIV